MLLFATMLKNFLDITDVYGVTVLGTIFKSFFFFCLFFDPVCLIDVGLYVICAYCPDSVLALNSRAGPSARCPPWISNFKLACFTFLIPFTACNNTCVVIRTHHLIKKWWEETPSYIKKIGSNLIRCICWVRWLHSWKRYHFGDITRFVQGDETKDRLSTH